MLSRTFKLAAIVGMVLSVAMCGQGFAKEPVRIGLVTSLSGNWAPQGMEVKRAIEFAIQQANANGGIDGRKVEVMVGDDESTVDGARRETERVARAGYNLLIGPIASSMSLTIAQNLDRWNAIYFMPISKANTLTGKSCAPRMFRTCASDSMDETMMIKWLKTVKEKNFSILAQDYTWGRDSAAFFKEAAAKIGKKIKLELYAPLGTKDYAPYISQLNSSGSDAVWVALVGGDIIAFAKQAKEFGLTKKMRIVGHAFVLNFVVNAVGSAMDGIWGNSGYVPSIPTKLNKEFVAAFTKKYGRPPTDNEGQAYNGAEVLFAGVKLAHSVKPADIARALPGATIDTIYGHVKMRAQDHQLLIPDYIVQVNKVGGKEKIVLEKTFEPASYILPPSPECRMGKIE